MRKLKIKIPKKYLSPQFLERSLLTLSVAKINAIDMGQDLRFFG